MDFKKILIDFLVSLLLFIRNLIFLIIFPYRALRKIILEPDKLHFYFFLFVSYIYFIFQENVRPVRFNAFFTFLIFLFNLFFLFFFLWFILKRMGKEIDFEALMVGYSYTLLPTLIWFFTNLFLYIILPPPRTTSFLGVSFSVVYITFSGVLFLWKLMLFYLLIRFLTGMSFFRVFYIILLTFLVFGPYFYLLYYFRIFRVPFI